MSTFADVVVGDPLVSRRFLTELPVDLFSLRLVRPNLFENAFVHRLARSSQIVAQPTNVCPSVKVVLNNSESNASRCRLMSLKI